MAVRPRGDDPDDRRDRPRRRRGRQPRFLSRRHPQQNRPTDLPQWTWRCARNLSQGVLPMRMKLRKIASSLAFALAATSAFAHAQLEKATPPVGGTVSPPSEIRLEFSEGVELKFTKVTLTGPRGAAAPLGSASTAAGNQAVLIVPIAKPLSAG